MDTEILQLRAHVSDLSRVVCDLHQVDAQSLNDERDLVILSLRRRLEVHCMELQTLGLQRAWP
jgi:hypothetical protein